MSEKMEKAVQRGDIWYVARGGREVGHETHAGRPAVVVSGDILNRGNGTVEVVFLSTKMKSLKTHVDLESSGRPSQAMCEQVHSVDKSRLTEFKGRCSEAEMDGIDLALMLSLGLMEPGRRETKHGECMRCKDLELRLKEETGARREAEAKVEHLDAAIEAIAAESEAEMNRKIVERIYEYMEE